MTHSPVLAPLAFFFQSNTSNVISWLYFTLVVVLIGLFLLFLRMRKEEEAKTRQQFQNLDDRLKSLDAKAGDLVQALNRLGDMGRENTEHITRAIESIQISAASSASVAATPTAAEEHEKDSPEPASQAQADSGDNPFDEALHLLRSMEDDHPNNLLKAKELFLKCTSGAKAGEAYILLSETLFWLGDISQNKNEKETYHGEGVEHGKKAVELAPDAVEAHLWFAANMGAHGMARGIMSSLFYLGDIDKHGSRAMSLDNRFFHGAPLRLMGRFYHQCPGWPIGKGDMNKAIKLLEQAVETGPEFLLNHFYLADAYIAKRKKREARKVLENMLKQDQFSVMPHYQKNVQSMARELLKKT